MLVLVIAVRGAVYLHQLEVVVISSSPNSQQSVGAVIKTLIPHLQYHISYRQPDLSMKSNRTNHICRLEQNSHLLQPPVNNYCVTNEHMTVMAISPLPTLTPTPTNLTPPPDRGRPKRPNRLPHKHNPRILLPIQRLHAPQNRPTNHPKRFDRRRRPRKIHRHPNKRRRHVPPPSKHAPQPRPLRKHSRHRD